ncbi:MAG: hypothetical protein JXN63_01915 [Candidatus Delongbacteria bacterium]|nr:hypothetical protein [Candidatus Delongbacteria bacterium]
MKRFILIILCALAAYSQELTITAVNNMNFGIGSEWGGDDKNVEIEKQYFEDWLDLEVFKGNFSAGLRFEAADPSSRNESLKEITRMSFNYANRGINITAGDFYGFFGRGLVFGLKESRSDFFDSKIRGGSFQYSGDLFCFKALGGKSYFKYVNDIEPSDQTVDQFDNKVLGGELSLPISTYLDLDEYYINIGGSYLYLEGEETPEEQYLYDEMFIEETGITGANVEVEAFGLAFFNEYALKTTKRTPSQTGWANYSSLSYAVKGFSVDLEFKDYYKYGANPNEISSGFTPYQSAPELIIAHSSHLLNTHPHVVNPNDEIGYKLTAAYQINERTELKAYSAFASLHNGGSILPEFSDDYLPYTDIWLNYGYTGEEYGFVFGAGYFLDSPLAKGYNIDIIPGGDNTSDVYADQRNTFMGEYYFRVGTDSKIALCGEFQTVSNEFKDEDYNDIYASVEYSYSLIGYINISLISTTEEVSGDSPDKWLGVEAGFDIMDDHKLNLFYGRERAGIKCAGGSCRQVPEFDGFKVSLVSYF